MCTYGGDDEKTRFSDQLDQILSERARESFIPLSYRFLVPVKVFRGSGFGSAYSGSHNTIWLVC